MELKTLKKLLKQSWTTETCVLGSRKEWNSDNPSLGQCAITALVVNDYFGGKIMRVMTNSGSHYYNLIDNKVIDLTVEQFNGEIPEYQKGEERTREYLLSNEDTKKRYLALLNNLEKTIDHKPSIIMHDLEIRNEKKHQMKTSCDYINWLIAFTQKNPYIDDYPDMMDVLNNATTEDLRKIKDIGLFFAIIDEYVAKHNGHILRNNDKNYYLIKYEDMLKQQEKYNTIYLREYANSIGAEAIPDYAKK